MDLKLKDVADLLNVSETTIRRWLTEGKIPAYRLHHQYRFNRTEIEDWMMRCKLKNEKDGFSAFEKEEVQQKGSILEQTKGMYQFGLYRGIHKGQVIQDLEGETKEELIRKAMRMAAPELSLDDEGIAELLLDREQLMPTALNHGIAVPHTRDFLLKGPFDVVIVAYLKKPIDWGSLDGQLVHTLFFLFASGDKRHLHLLAKIAHLSSDFKALEVLKRRPEKQELLEFIKEWEAKVRQYE